MLQQEREDIQHALNDALLQQEELKEQVESKNLVAAKRLQNLLQRNPPQNLKDLMIQTETLNDLNADLEKKLAEEQQKSDKLRRQKMELAEQLKLKQLQLKEDSQSVEANEKEIG